MEVIIRKANNDDINELIEFGKLTFTKTFGHLYPSEDLNNYLNESYSNDRFLTYINNDKYFTYIAINNDNIIIGYIIASKGVDLPHDDITNNCYEIIKLYISENSFGKGISYKLMDEVIKWYESDSNRNDLWLRYSVIHPSIHYYYHHYHHYYHHYYHHHHHHYYHYYYYHHYHHHYHHHHDHHYHKCILRQYKSSEILSEIWF